jgi:hypothetical protein
MTDLRPIIGFPNYYIDSDGVVWSNKKKGGNDRRPGRIGDLRQLKISRNKRGYCIVGLDVGGRNVSRFVHRLVLEAFVGPRPDGKEACHFPDHDKTNNQLSNLRWDTHDENEKDHYRDRPPVVMKACRRCGFPKPIDQFFTDKRASDGHQGECRKCHGALAVATRDPEKKRKANREHMRRVRADRRAA